MMSSIVKLSFFVSVMGLLCWGISSASAESHCTTASQKNNVIVNCDNKNLLEFPAEEIPLNVTSLFIRQNLLTTLTESALTPFQSLHKVYFSFNKFTSIPIINSSAITDLYFDNNQITDATFPDRFNCPQLNLLNLAQNQIDSLESAHFANRFAHLQSLLLNVNPLSSVPEDAFSSLESTLLALYIKGSTKLSKGSLPKFLSSIRSLSKLRTLDLSGSFKGVSVSQNLTKDLFTDALYSNTLAFLFLDSNNFLSIGTETFSDLKKLETLSLKESSITSLESGAFAKASSLKTLLLQGNSKLQGLPDGVFSGSDILQTVTLSYCVALQSIHPNAFSVAPKLQVLKMDHCGLTKIEGATFASLGSSLLVLDLQSNQFQGLDEAKVGDGSAFAGLSSLKDLNVTSNQFDCSCNANGWFISWLQNQKGVNIFQIDSLLCSSPDEYRGKRLINISCADISSTASSPISSTIMSSISSTTSELTTNVQTIYSSSTTTSLPLTTSSSSSTQTSSATTQYTSIAPPKMEAWRLPVYVIGIVFILLLSTLFTYQGYRLYQRRYGTRRQGR
jgi:hypothetical protein